MHRSASALVMAAVFLLASLPAAAQFCDQELLTNGGCDAPLVAGEIPGWTEVTGTGWTARSANPAPHQGSAYFDAGEAATAELVQDVALGLLPKYANGWNLHGAVRTGPESPSDLIRIIAEYRNPAGDVLLTLDTGDVSSPVGWTSLNNIVGSFHWVPNEASSVRIRIIATRRSGTTNDGYVDSLSLVANCPDPVEPTTWSAIKTRHDYSW